MNKHKRLKFCREHAGLTQGQAARSLGWHRPKISELEAGRQYLRAEEAIALARLYRVSVCELLGVRCGS